MSEETQNRSETNSAHRPNTTNTQNTSSVPRNNNYGFDRKPQPLMRKGLKRMSRMRRPHRLPVPSEINKEGPREAQKVEIPPVGENIRIIPLGGVEEIGKNMTAIEIGNDIIVIDAGFQFTGEETPGVDYILPNTKYLEERKERIRAMFITHGHLDHIGAVPYVLDRIGNPPVYSRQFGAIMVQKRQEEFPHMPKPDIRILEGEETIRIGENFVIETFPISHTIPDSMGLIIHTKWGDIVFIEDVRVDNVDGVPTQEEYDHYKRFAGKEALLLTMDSTSVEKSGYSISESVVIRNIEKIIKETHSRLVIGTFASQVERILAIIEAADRYGKKVAIEGRSMKTNVEIIKFLGLVKTKNIISVNEIENVPPDKLILLVTGAQGEEFAALMRMANKTHKYVQLKKTDTVLLSSSIIPTNYNSVIRLKDFLYRSEAHVITYLDSDVHASGHGNREELRWIHQQIKYRFFIPLHGYHFLLKQHSELSESVGTPKENIIVPDNGSIIEISDGGKKIGKLAMKAPHERITVDGTSVGDIQDVVIGDRQLLSEAGIFMVVASVNMKTGKLRKSPDIISRGFVYLRESQELLRKARFIIKRVVENGVARAHGGQVDFDRIKRDLTEELNKFLFQETAKQPLVIPVILGV